ncbi:aminotransferase class IV [Natronomonas sp.]|uniref:aminotransferase class IV n=1 Tax=Natronomonas sp. TaxID=2184060 RepID=UPI002FC3BB43
MQYHVNGELVDRGAATVSVDDRGFRYGDAAFETCRVYGGTVFAWERHLDRLEATCETLGMPEAVPDDIESRIDETLTANDLDDAYLRVSISRGVQPGKLTPHEDVDPTVVVYVKPLPRGGTDGERVWDAPATVQSVTRRRPPDTVLPADAKTHNYLNGILARLELRRASREGYQPDEALMRDTDGYLAEGATSNVFFVDDGILRTPAEGSVLPGITRETVIELAEEEDFTVDSGQYTIDDLRGADEAFLTNSTWEIRPIATADGIDIGDGPMTKLLQRLYDERIEARCY